MESNQRKCTYQSCLILHGYHSNKDLTALHLEACRDTIRGVGSVIFSDQGISTKAPWLFCQLAGVHFYRFIHSTIRHNRERKNINVFDTKK